MPIKQLTKLDNSLADSWENLDTFTSDEIIKFAEKKGFKKFNSLNNHLQIQHAYQTLLEENKNLPYHFNLLNELHSDENAHSRVLCKLLEYDPNKDHSYPLAVSFVQNMIGVEITDAWQKSKKPLNIVFNRDFIDLAIWKEKSVGIIIENKIQGAVDQEQQLENYTEKMINNYKYRCVPYAIYLTWNGIKEVSSVSLTDKAIENLSEDKNTKDLKRFFARNYVYNILPWLKKEILPHIFYQEKYIIAGLEQYIDYLETRASIRPADLKKNEAIYKAILESY